MNQLTLAAVITIAILALPTIIIKIALVAAATATIAIGCAKLHADSVARPGRGR